MQERLNGVTHDRYVIRKQICESLNGIKVYAHATLKKIKQHLMMMMTILLFYIQFIE